MGVRNSVTPPKSGYNKETIRSDIRYLVVSKDVRRHRLISIDYIKTLCCHGRGRALKHLVNGHSTPAYPQFLKVTGRKSGTASCFGCRQIPGLAATDCLLFRSEEALDDLRQHRLDG